MLKIKILLKSYLQLFFQDFLYLTALFTLVVFGLTGDYLLNINPIKKYSLLLIGTFFLGLVVTMNIYRKDSRQNKYLKQKVASYWADVVSQFLVALIVNIFSGVMIFIFSLILNQNVKMDMVGILTLIGVGLLGSGIATLFKMQWGRYTTLGQIGVLVFIYLALSGSVINVLSYVEWFLPPLSKAVVALQRKPSITQLLPITGQIFLYALVLFVISSLVYYKKKKS